MAEIESKITGPGEILAIARKKTGLSIDDIAARLNLSPRVIGQLESDQYTDDIPDAFIRGYLRTYARAVDIDEQQMISLYSEYTGISTVRNYYVPSADVPPVKIQVGSHLLWFRILSIAVFITILVLGWIAFSQTDSNSIYDLIAKDTAVETAKETPLIMQKGEAVVNKTTAFADDAQSVELNAISVCS